MDLGLLLYELRKNELEFLHTIVHSKKDFETALANFRPDIILSDYNLPAFDGQKAFWIKQGKRPELPFIIVSGAVGEENAHTIKKCWGSAASASSTTTFRPAPATEQTAPSRSPCQKFISWLDSQAMSPIAATAV